MLCLRKSLYPAVLFLVATASLPAQCSASMIIIGGQAKLMLLEGKAASISEFDAYFGDAASRSETLSLPSPGTAPFTEDNSGVSLVDSVRPFGETAPSGTPGAGRTRQATTLHIENPADILGSWAASTDSFGIFARTGPSGEQIAFTGMQRWTGPFTGVLVYGDFALRYLPGRNGTVSSGGTLSGLVLTSNIDFLNSSWADLANATISISGGKLLINADLLISGALNVLDPTAAVGTKFGTFSLTADFQQPTVVPEPTSLALFGCAGGIIAIARRRRSNK